MNGYGMRPSSGETDGGPPQCNSRVGSQPKGAEVRRCVCASVGERRNFEVFTRFWRAPYRKIRSGRSTPASGPRAGARRFLTRRIVARRPGASRCGGVCVELPTLELHCGGPGRRPRVEVAVPMRVRARPAARATTMQF